METIEIDGWQGRIGAGLGRRQLEALVLACADMTIKQIAKRMQIAPGSAKQNLDDARYKLGMQRSIRGACLEALRRGIVSPLLLALCAVIALDEMPHDAAISASRRIPERKQETRIARRVEHFSALAA